VMINDRTVVTCPKPGEHRKLRQVQRHVALVANSNQR